MALEARGMSSMLNSMKILKQSIQFEVPITTAIDHLVGWLVPTPATTGQIEDLPVIGFLEPGCGIKRHLMDVIIRMGFGSNHHSVPPTATPEGFQTLLVAQARVGSHISQVLSGVLVPLGLGQK
jgi:hypothetical protein